MRGPTFATYPRSSILRNSAPRQERGSPSNGSRCGVRISQITRAEGPFAYFVDRIWNVEGSGKASISDSSIGTNPSTAEPSKPTPSSKASSRSSAEMAKDLRVPSTSVNHSLTKRISRFSTVLSTKSILRSSLMSCLLVANTRMRGARTTHVSEHNNP